MAPLPKQSDHADEYRSQGAQLVGGGGPTSITALAIRTVASVLCDSGKPGYSLGVRLFGGGLLVVGGAVLVHAFNRFVVEGLGTPAPPAPTDRLVVGGLYRYVRNPMYLAVGAAIVGQALLVGRPGLLVCALVVMAATVAFAHWYEEPTLRRRFGPRYERYRAAVPGWLPRRRPWSDGDPGPT